MYLHPMESSPIHIILADDDLDDCMFFEEALQELQMPFNLTTANDGEQLMRLLSGVEDRLPNVLFLDLNMPRKNGFECLVEIKKSDKLKALPVIIYSTSLDAESADFLHKNGAKFYMRKPGEFSKLKDQVDKALKLLSQPNGSQGEEEKFIIN